MRCRTLFGTIFSLHPCAYVALLCFEWHFMRTSCSGICDPYAVVMSADIYLHAPLGEIVQLHAHCGCVVLHCQCTVLKCTYELHTLEALTTASHMIVPQPAVFVPCLTHKPLHGPMRAMQEGEAGGACGAQECRDLATPHRREGWGRGCGGRGEKGRSLQALALEICRIT